MVNGQVSCSLFILYMNNLTQCFQGMVKVLKEKQFDMSFAQFSVTAERAQVLDQLIKCLHTFWDHMITGY